MTTLYTAKYEANDYHLTEDKIVLNNQSDSFMADREKLIKQIAEELQS